MTRLLGVSLVLALGLGSNAFAADNPQPAAAPAAAAPATTPAVKAPPAAPAYNWTGCHVGVVGGGIWGDSEDTARSGAFAGSTITGSFKLNGGATAGGTLGCDYQIEKTVIGLENDASWTNVQGTRLELPPFNTLTTSTTRETWIDTLRGRVGYAYDQFLFYGTAGAAFAGTTITVNSPFGTVSDSKPRIGIAIGAGGEWAAWSGPWGALSLKLEYLHTDFGSKEYINPPAPVVGTTVTSRDVKLTDDMVRVGVNVRLNWGATTINLK